MIFKQIKTSIMKNKLIIIFALSFAFIACDNQENEFDDYGKTSLYFPFQTPVRTLILGEYDLGFNENDNNSRFEIGVTMSGVYKNEKDRKVHFELAPDLIDASLLEGVDSVNVKVLPASYYTIEQESPLTIPVGSIKGRIPVQLNDAFFDDPQAFAEYGEVHYVIPLRITKIEDLDTLLMGTPIVENPIKIRDEDWSPLPKDYTLYGIKFMNRYQGTYLRRGADRIVGSSDNNVYDRGLKIGDDFIYNLNSDKSNSVDIDTTSVYRSDYVIEDELTSLATAGKNSVIVNSPVRRAGLAGDNLLMKLIFDDNNSIIIDDIKGDGFVVRGSGSYVKDGDEWGGEKRDVIYLEYEYEDTNEAPPVYSNRGKVRTISSLNLTHTVKDTLVIRDRDVKFEEFTLELKGEALTE